jgi:hypothetical protein
MSRDSVMRRRAREEGPSDELTLLVVRLCVVLVAGTVLWAVVR